METNINVKCNFVRDVVVTDYNETLYSRKRIESLTDLENNPLTTTWIDIKNPDEQVIQDISSIFKIHPIVARDLKNVYRHPTAEDFNDYIFIVCKLLRFSNNVLTTSQVSFLLGKNFILSIQECQSDIFDNVIEKINEPISKIRRETSDYLIYELLDCIIESYFSTIESIVDEIENLEERVLNNPTKEDSEKIHKLKRQIIAFRKEIWATRELAVTLTKFSSNIIQEKTQIYLRDVYDRVVQILDTVESLRDILTGVLDIYLSSISNRMNEIMKFLTIVSTIFIPLTLLSGIYGMNFEFMPELHYKYGYPILICFMLCIAIGMLFWFKRKKWI